jgi:site-specific recombinase XerD
MEPKISFKLKDKNNPTLILMHVNCGIKVLDTLKNKTKYTPVIVSTGCKISQENWDNEKKLPLTSFTKKDKRIQIILNQYEKAAFDAIEAIKLDANLKLTAETVKFEIVKRVGKKDKKVLKKQTSFSEYIDHKLKTTNFNVNTLKGHKSFLNQVKRFEEKYGKIILEDLTKETIEKFFYSYLMNEDSYTNNSLSKIRGRFSTFLTKAKKDGFEIGCTMEESGITFQRYTPDDIRLTLQELKALIDLKLDNEYHKRVRDIFIILCFTGQRVSEYKLIKEGTVLTKTIGGIDTKFIKLIPSELNNKKKIVHVPLMKPVLDIIGDKYVFPEMVPEQKINEIIKELCEEVGIDERIEAVDIINGGKTKKRSQLKHQMVKSHTARRSFISNFLELGIPDDCISRITGHRLNYNASKAFSSYVKLDDEVNVARFFKELEFLKKLKELNYLCR